MLIGSRDANRWFKLFELTCVISLVSKCETRNCIFICQAKQLKQRISDPDCQLLITGSAVLFFVRQKTSVVSGYNFDF